MIWRASTFLFFLLLSASALADINNPMSFRYVFIGGNCSFCQYTIAEGIIERDTVDKFRTYLEEPGLFPGYIRFHSEGGSIDGALELGKAIRQRNMQTVIARGDVCFSACAYAFLGGSQRRIGRAFEDDGWTAPDVFLEGNLEDGPWAELHGMDGCIGVHQFFSPESVGEPDRPVYSPRNVSAAQRLVGRLTEYVRQMGVSPAFVETASRISPFQDSTAKSVLPSGGCRLDPSNVFVIPGNLLAQWRVVTDISEHARWTLQATDEGISARIVQDQHGHHVASIDVLKLPYDRGSLFLRYTLIASSYKSTDSTPDAFRNAIGIAGMLSRYVLTSSAELIVDSISAGFCELTSWSVDNDHVYSDCKLSDMQVRALMEGHLLIVDIPVAHVIWSIVYPSEFPLDGSKVAIERVLRHPI